MPPVRTQKTKPVRDGSLASYGFLPVPVPVPVPAPVPALASIQPAPEQTPHAHQPGEAPDASCLKQTTPAPKSQTPAPPAKTRGRPKKAALHKGKARAVFNHQYEWDAGELEGLGSSTHSVTFGYDFNLRPEHVDRLLATPGLCRGLRTFAFDYRDVSYGANNKAALGDESVLELAAACPKLRSFTLPHTHGKITDAALRALLSGCPDLTHAEFPWAVGDDLFGEMLAHPEWCPKLKRLRVRGVDSGLKQMRLLSVAREKLLIEFVAVQEVKKWGDWELETSVGDRYQNGRKQRGYHRY